MKVRDFTALFLALALSSVPVTAQASAAHSRATAPIAEANQMARNSTLLYILAAIGLGVAIYLIANNNNNDHADSP